MELFSDGCAAQNAARFKKPHRLSRFCQIPSTGQTIVAATNNDDIGVRIVGSHGLHSRK